jgi:hypothetical protein
MDGLIYEKLLNNKKLIQRFVKDYALPVNIYEGSLFLHYKDIYSNFNGFFPAEAWNCLIETIADKFGGNVEQWLDYCAEVRDKAINEIKTAPEYNEFITMNMAPYTHVSPVGEHSCYNGETDGKKFISFDLRKANFQALKFVGVIKDKSYEDFIIRMGGDDYIVGSKYLRQVIFGNCNPSRQVTIEKHLIDKVRTYIRNYVDWFDMRFKDFSANADEIVFITDENVEAYANSAKLIESVIKTELGIEIKADFFTIKKLPITNINNDSVDAYVKHSYVDGSDTLKKASTTFFPQIWKLWKGLDIQEVDRKVYIENQIATFDYPLMLKYNDNV